MPETGAACDDTVTAQQARAPAKAANARCFIYCSFEAVNYGPTRKQPLCLRVRKREMAKRPPSGAAKGTAEPGRAAGVLLLLPLIGVATKSSYPEFAGPPLLSGNAARGPQGVTPRGPFYSEAYRTSVDRHRRLARLRAADQWGVDEFRYSGATMPCEIAALPSSRSAAPGAPWTAVQTSQDRM